jgi:hypothetical protein
MKFTKDNPDREKTYVSLRTLNQTYFPIFRPVRIVLPVASALFGIASGMAMYSFANKYITNREGADADVDENCEDCTDATS